MLPKIKGHSGDRVEFRGDTVFKTGNVKRLHLQAELLEHLADAHLPGIAVPRVLSVTSDGYEMEYIEAPDTITFLQSCNPSDVTWLFTRIKSFLENCKGRSEQFYVSAETIANKASQVIQECRKNPHLTASDLHLVGAALNTGYGGLEVPVGQFHGDLTLSNMLVDRERDTLWLIDPLPSFVNSCALDLAKIRQEARMRWTEMLSGRYVEDNRMSRFLGMLNSLTIGLPAELEVLNLCRILPYVRERRIAETVLQCLRVMRWTSY